MEPKLNIPENRKINLLSRLTLILFGIFLTSLIFAITVKTFEETGIWIGLTISIILIFCGFYYKKQGTKTRIIAWTMLITLIAVIISYYIGLNYIEKTFEKFQSK